MKTYKALAIALVVLVILASGLQAAPKMTIPVNEFDFGYAPQHSKLSHTFWLYSTGTDSLKILKVKPG